MAYLTPDTYPASKQCRVLRFPDNPQWASLVYAALLSLTYRNEFEAYGSVTPDECAAEFLRMFDDFAFRKGVCRVIGEIIPFAGSASPDDNWLLCNGASLAIADYPSLYDVIGDIYGSEDSSHFNLPDLRGRAPIGYGAGVDLTERTIGSIGGEEDHQLTVMELAAHSHNDSGHSHSIGGAVTGLAVAPGELTVLVPSIPTTTGSAEADIQQSGEDEPHNNMQPWIAINYLIVAKE